MLEMRKQILEEKLEVLGSVANGLSDAYEAMENCEELFKKYHTVLDDMLGEIFAKRVGVRMELKEIEREEIRREETKYEAETGKVCFIILK